MTSIGLRGLAAAASGKGSIETTGVACAFEDAAAAPGIGAKAPLGGDAPCAETLQKASPGPGDGGKQGICIILAREKHWNVY